jgi:hypothetical protein
MKNQELTQQESNILIAEFMGVDAVDVDFHLETSELTYHTSWDWLMPVVEKINLLNDYRYTTYIASMDTRIEDNVTGKVIVDINCEHSIDELIQSVYKAVVQFIQWYNSKKA